MTEKSVNFDISDAAVASGESDGGVRSNDQQQQQQPPSPPHPQQHSHHHYGERLRRLVHPKTGRVLHIVRSHGEVEPTRVSLRKQSTGGTDEFDILVHGTEDHISAVRDIQKHHEDQRDHLRTQNSDLVSQYETVRTELDRLNNELHLLTDHAVSLDASFDKYGYSARLRTTGDHDPNSTADFDDGASGHESTDEARTRRQHDRSVKAIKFWKRPVVRQYFHKGLIWRSPHSSEVASFELFVDLVYVSVIDTLGEAAVTNASGSSFLHYVIVFALSWKIFSDMTTFVNWIEVEDIISRVTVCFNLVMLYGFTTNIANGFEQTYTAGVSFYLASRFLTAFWWIFVGITTPMIRGTLLFHALATAIGVAVWIGSIHVEYPKQLALIWVAILIDLLGSALIVPVMHSLSQRWELCRSLRPLFEYLPAINIEHRIERIGAFVSLVFGYSVITIIFQSAARFPLDAFLGKGILALMQAFTFNWLYFEIDGWGIHVHAIRRSRISTFLWTFAHLPFAAGFILAASSLKELVIAHDSGNANVEWLAEEYALESHGEVDQTIRWFYCGGLGVALLSMTVISLSHVHKRIPNARLLKRPRLAIRTAVAIAIICLPLAHDLNSLDLLGITTSLVVFCLILDLFGSSCSGDSFWLGGFCKEDMKSTTYEAKCRLSRKRRRDMSQKVGRGETVTLDQVLKRDGTGSQSSLESADTRVGDRDGGAGTYV